MPAPLCLPSFSLPPCGGWLYFFRVPRRYTYILELLRAIAGAAWVRSVTVCVCVCFVWQAKQRPVHSLSLPLIAYTQYLWLSGCLSLSFSLFALVHAVSFKVVFFFSCVVAVEPIVWAALPGPWRPSYLFGDPPGFRSTPPLPCPQESPSSKCQTFYMYIV